MFATKSADARGEYVATIHRRGAWYDPTEDARHIAEAMGGEVAFGPSGLLLYRADLVFLKRVKAQREAAALKLYRA